MSSLQKFAMAFAATCALLSSAIQAEAGLVVKIEAFTTGLVPTGTVVIVDQEGVGGVSDQGSVATHADAAGPVGTLSFSGTIGGFAFTVAVGDTYPAFGAFDEPSMHLNIFVSGGPGILKVSFTATDFELNPDTVPNFVAFGNVGGAAGASASVLTEYYTDTTNAEFGTETLIGTGGPFGPGAFSTTVGPTDFPSTNPFSMTIVGTITHTSATTTSLDTNLYAAVPEPTSMAILGLGGLLAGCGVARRKRKQAVELTV